MMTEHEREIARLEKQIRTPKKKQRWRDGDAEAQKELEIYYVRLGFLAGCFWDSLRHRQARKKLAEIVRVAAFNAAPIPPTARPVKRRKRRPVSR
jgi:hypothetical protein